MRQQTTRISPEDISRQLQYCREVAALSAARPAQPLAFVDTYGCQQNEADSERIRGYLREMGYGFTQDEEQAQIIVLNTCAIREHAEQRVLGNLGALVHVKRRHPEQIICVCGCMAQEPHMAQKIKDSYRQVDLVFGPHALWRFPELLYRLVTRRGRIFDIADEPGSIAEGIPLVRQEGVKAWVSIMYGCNNFCTYCIIPYARGRVRSLPVEQALEQTARLADAGVHEIVLTGIEIASYGKDFEPQVPLTELLEKLLTAQPNVQFRLGSLDPRAVGDAFCERLAGFANLARHFHLSMQSGCDTVLRRMNRHYTSEEFYRCVERLRRAFPDCSVTTDLIVGFPGETEDEFTQTLDFLERCAFASVHVFPYSVREGTKAAAMPGQLDQQTKTARAERAKQVAETLSAAYRKQFVGRTLYALPEHPTGGLWAAHGRYGFPVYIEDEAEKNHPVTVKVIGLHKDGVLAKIEN